MVKKLYLKEGKRKVNPKRVEAFKQVIEGCLVAVVILFIVFGMGGVKDILTPYALKENVINYEQRVSISADSSQEQVIELKDHPEKFELTAFKVSGEVEKDSIIKVYLDNGEERLEVFDSGEKFGITGLAASDKSKGKGQEKSAGKGNNKSDEGAGEEVPEEEGVVEEESEELIEEEIPEESAEEESLSEEEVAEEGTSVSERTSGFEEECSKTCRMKGKGFVQNEYKLIFEVYQGSINIDKIIYSLVDLTEAAVPTVEFDSEIYNEIALKGKANVIVELKERKTQVNSEQNAVLSSLSVAPEGAILSEYSNNEFKVRHRYKTVGALSGEVNQKGLEKLLSNPKVERVYVDKILEVTLTDTVPLINADDVQAMQVGGVDIDGSGGSVCVIDTGVEYTHTSLVDRIVGQKCYCSVSGSACCPNAQQEDTDAFDDNGHGTHVAGIVASINDTYTGVAPGAGIVAVKACNNLGYCAGSDIIAGIEWCLVNAELYNIDVISMSIGGVSYTDSCDGVSQSMTDAIDNAVSQGVMVAISSGNNGYSDKISWPSCVQNAISVGAVDKTDATASYSNRNSLLDYMAPGGSSGNQVISTVLGNNFGGKYGTSMATPHFAGAVLLLKQYSQLYNGVDLSISEVKSLLSRNAVEILDSSNNLTYNRIDIEAAVNSILRVNETENSVEKIGEGKVTFGSATNLTSVSEAFTIGDNSISLNSSSWPQFDKEATLNIYGLSFEKEPIVLRDGVVCGDCTVGSYSDGDFVFDVPGFTAYSAGANSELNIWDEADSGMPWYGGNANPDEDVMFFANYTDRVTGGVISNGDCKIGFSDGVVDMVFNVNNSVFEYSKSFSVMDVYSYEANCTDGSYENMLETESVMINKSTPSIILAINGQVENIEVLRNNVVEISASLTEPAGEDVELYLDGGLINIGSDVSNETSFAEFGSHNVSAVYVESSEYNGVAEILTIEVMDDSESPQWSGDVLSSEGYGVEHEFVLNWTDNIGIDSSWIEHNFSGVFANYSMTAGNAGEYSYSYASSLALGSYSVKFYANDTSGNVNETGVMSFEVVKGVNAVFLSINGNVNANTTLSYQNINVTAYSSGGSVALFKEGVAITNPEVAWLNAGNYTYNVNASGDTNYYDNSTGIEFTLLVTKASSEIILTLNGDEESISRAAGKDVEIVADLITPGNLTVKILEGSSTIEEGTSPLSTTESFSSDSEITAEFEGNTNYLSSTDSHWVDIISDDSEDTTDTASEAAATTSAAGGAAATYSGCTMNWECTDWGACISGIESRTCTDANDCGTVSGKPTETRTCGSGCAENWQCGEWTDCVGDLQTRECNDQNLCGRNFKVEEQECVSGILGAPMIANSLNVVMAFLKEKKEISMGVGAVILASLGYLGYYLFAVRKFKMNVSMEKLKSVFSNIKLKR